jgi:hypothetical protein
LQLIASIDWPIFGEPATRTPTAVRDTVLNREIERGTVGASLPAGNNRDSSKPRCRVMPIGRRNVCHF